VSVRAERVVFAGAPAFAATLLSALLAAKVPLVGVLSQPDRPAGRGRKLQESPVKTLARAAGLPIATPLHLRSPENREALEDWAPDLLIVAAYGLILPKPVLALPKHGCLNVHASLLPRWRGAAPLERAIMAGDEETGVCIMEMESGLDTGPVRHRLHVPLTGSTTGGELEATLAELGAKALLTVLDDLSNPAYAPVPQACDGVCYAEKLTANDRFVDFTQPAAQLARQINALSPRLPPTIESEDALRIRCLLASAQKAETAGAPPGSVVGIDKAGLHLATGQGTLTLKRLQVLKGKASLLDGAAFLNGYGRQLKLGTRFVSA